MRTRWPRLPPGLVADVLAGHSAVGLALGAAIYLICLTGTLCVLIDELKLWEAPQPAPAGLTLAALDPLAVQGLALAGGAGKASGFYLRAPTTPRERAGVDIGERSFTPDAHGRLAPLATPWSDFLTDLHIKLTLPDVWGEMIVGLLGMGLFSLLVSGVLAHPRILRDAFVLRLGGSRRLQEADLHNRLGVWGLPFHLTVTATGALFGLANLLVLVVSAVGFHGDESRTYRPLTGPAVAADPRPAPIPPLAPIVARSLKLTPGSRFYYVGVERPGTRGERITVEVLTPGRLSRGDQAFYDATGALIGRGRFATGGLGLQIYSGAAQTHFGFFGGLPVRIAYVALGLALTVVCAGGMNIWLARRRDRGRPAPRLERAWAAWVWGAPTALALAALPFAPGTATARAAVFWGAAVVIVAAGQRVARSPSPERSGAQAFRRVLGVTLLAVAGVAFSRSLASATAIFMNILVGLMGVALIVQSGRDVLRWRPGR